jgi:hypothetical protein
MFEVDPSTVEGGTSLNLQNAGKVHHYFGALKSSHLRLQVRLGILRTWAVDPCTSGVNTVTSTSTGCPTVSVR